MAKLAWGMIGGGEGSQTGPAHRIGAAVESARLGGKWIDARPPSLRGASGQ